MKMSFDNVLGTPLFIERQETEDDLVLCDNNGFVMEYEQLQEVCSKLLSYAKRNEKDLIAYNLKHQVEYEKQFNQHCLIGNEKKPNPSRIYMFECDGLYKIGVSKNVEARLNQLNVGPTMVSLVTYSDEIENAFEVEKLIHSSYAVKRVRGEWFRLNTKEKCDLIEYIEQLGDVVDENNR